MDRGQPPCLRAAGGQQGRLGRLAVHGDDHPRPESGPRLPRRSLRRDLLHAQGRHGPGIHAGGPTRVPDHPRGRAPAGAGLHAARAAPPGRHVGSRRRGQAPARADGVPRLVLRAVRREAARGHDARRRHREGPQGRHRVLRREPRAADVWAVRPNFNANLDNLRLLDEQTALDEITLFRRAGGQTVIDPTNASLSRDPLALTRISRATGLNIVMGAGYYVAAAHPADMDTRSEDSIVREIVREVTLGVGDTGVRAGLIGEIGNTWPWTENEKKVVRAAVEAQRQTGAPLMIHPGRDQAAPMQIVELISKQGGNLKATVMCHIERTIADERHLVDLAATGIWLEYDLFGLENSYYPYNPDFDMPNDAGRMEPSLKLIARGHPARIHMSHH